MPGSQIAAIMTAVASLLSGVSGVQRVYKYQPIHVAPGQIPTVMGSAQSIHYWAVRPESTRTVRLIGYQVEIHHVIAMRGYITVGDPSVTTPTVDALVVAIQTAFDAAYTLTASASVTGPIEILWSSNPEGGYLLIAETFPVHAITIKLPVQEYLALA